jgi:hypothetical protein
MSRYMAAVPKDHPLMKAWEEYRSSPAYTNTFKWAADLEHRQGSLWAAFVAGFDAATERAASLHESVNPASDDERHDHIPGAGAMGAVIQYRDLIRCPR